MLRSSYFARAFALTAFLGLGVIAGCDSEADEMSLAAAQRLKILNACHLNDGTIEDDADLLRACDPQNTKKTTVCHVPPGNPANAHTICIGNAAVAKHLHNHGDYLGPCKREVPCQPPPSTGSGGAGGGDTSTGSGGVGGDTSTGSGGVGGDSSTGTGGAGGGPIIVK